MVIHNITIFKGEIIALIIINNLLMTLFWSGGVRKIGLQNFSEFWGHSESRALRKKTEIMGAVGFWTRS